MIIDQLKEEIKELKERVALLEKPFLEKERERQAMEQSDMDEFRWMAQERNEGIQKVQEDRKHKRCNGTIWRLCSLLGFCEDHRS